jgi:hypothetical protein
MWKPKIKIVIKEVTPPRYSLQANRDSYVSCAVAQEIMGSYFDAVERDPQRLIMERIRCVGRLLVWWPARRCWRPSA